MPRHPKLHPHITVSPGTLPARSCEFSKTATIGKTSRFPATLNDEAPRPVTTTDDQSSKTGVREGTAARLIHDSYGTHACDTDLLHVAIREAFIEQYERNVLGEFLDELRAQLEPDLAAQLPPLPPVGQLKLASVREARYFFA